MNVEFVCPNCSHSSKVDAQAAGQQITCPNCHQTAAASLPPPVLPGSSGTQNPYLATATSSPTPSIGDDAAVRMLLPVGRSFLAIVAGYFGLFSILCFPAPISIILGLLALRDIKQSGGKKHGMGRAWFGLIMGIIFTLLPLGFLAVAYIVEQTK